MVLNFYAIYFSVSDQNKRGYITGNIVSAIVLLALSRSLSLSWLTALAGVWIFGFTAKLIFDNRFIFKKAPPILSILAVGWFWFFAGAVFVALSGVTGSSALYVAGVHSIGTEKTATKNILNAEKEFHIYAMEWTADKITGYVDGVAYFTFMNDKKNDKKTWPFNAPFYLKLNLAWGGNWGGSQGIDETKLPATYEIDYVRVYQK
jgi:hypothetical protein